MEKLEIEMKGLNLNHEGYENNHDKIKNQNFKHLERVFDFFLIMGLQDEVISGKKTLEQIKDCEPEILSIFPDDEINQQELPQKDKIKKLKKKFSIRKMISNIKRRIFPDKADYIKDITEENLDKNIPKGIYEDYIFYSCDKPKEFFHCFSSKYQPDDIDTTYLIHFSVLIFYEQILVNSQQIEGGKYYYAAKALIFSSNQAYYILHKKILEEIYKRHLESVEQPLELMIMKLYKTLSFHKSNPILINFFGFEYLIDSEKFLPFFDLNLFAFFDKFNYKDFLIIAEFFLKRWPIIIFSKESNLLYPTFFTILNLIYPLNITNLNDYFILLSSEIISNVLPTPVASFLCINSSMPSDEIMTCIVQERQTNTIFIDLDSKEERFKIFEYNPEDKTVSFNNDYKESIIIHIFDEYITAPGEINLISLIRIELENICDLIYKQENRLKDYFEYLTPGSKEYSLSVRIRKLSFSLFSKLLMFNIPYTEISIINQNYEEFPDRPKNQIEISLSEKIEDVKLKDFYSYFATTPSFNVVYKHKCSPNDSNLINLILLDELIKVLKNDKKRLYFDQCLSIPEKIPENSENIKINEDNLFFNFGSYHNALHIYNLILLRNFKEENSKNKIIKFKNAPFVFDDLGGDNYLINYKRLVLYFKNFENFLNKNYAKLDKDICLNIFLNNELLYSKNSYNFNILLNEIQAFEHLIKTGTLIITDLKLIVLVIIILLLSLRIFYNLNNLHEFSEEIKFSIMKKFEIILNLYKNNVAVGNKFSFISSLIYEILFSFPYLREKYELDFLNYLKEYKITPTFNIYIKANDITKEKSNKDFYKSSIFFDKKSEINVYVPKIKNEFLHCINGCNIYQYKKEEKIKSIICSNMTAVKCTSCNEENILFLLTNFEDIGEVECVLRNPMLILRKIISNIIENENISGNNFIFENVKLTNLLDPLGSEDVRILLFFINFYYIPIEYESLFH
jgi:hypothetical protein